MQLFMILGTDSPEGAPRRAGLRPSHLEHIGRLVEQGRIRWAGPWLDAAGQKPLGSLILMEAADRSELDRIVAQDPYVAGGVFGDVAVHPIRQVIPAETTGVQAGGE